MSMKTKEVYGIKAIKLKTPAWSNWALRITVIITTPLAGWIYGTELIEESLKTEFILGLKFLDAVIYGLSRLVGMQEEVED
jgi:hydrogenase/urease accessory protein HupE